MSKVTKIKKDHDVVVDVETREGAVHYCYDYDRYLVYTEYNVSSVDAARYREMQPYINTADVLVEGVYKVKKPDIIIIEDVL